MTNSDLVEEYGFKAANAGKFHEWRDMSASIKENNPKMHQGDLAIKAYNMVVGSV